MKNDIFWAVSFLPVMQELFRTSKCWKKAENKRGRGGREREREREREGGREGGCTCCSLVVAPLVPSPNLSSWCELTCTELTTLLSVYFVILSPPFFINSFHSLLLLRILVELPNLSNIY